MSTQAPIATDVVDALLAESEHARQRGRHAEGAALADAVIADPHATPWQIAQAHAASARHRQRLGDLQVSIDHAQRGLALAAQAPQDTQATFRSGLHTVLAMAYDSAGLHQQSLKHVIDALALAREARDPVAECWALSRAALMSEALGHARARRYGDEALALARGLGEEEVEFAVLNNLASTGLELSDDAARTAAFGGAEAVLREACAYAEQALALALRQGNAHRQAVARSNLAEALLRLGRLDEARTAMRAASEQAWQEGYRGLAMANEVDLCKLDAAQGDADGARCRLLELLDQTDPDDDLSLAAQVRKALHGLCKSQGLFEQALEHHEQLLVLELRRAEERAGLQAQVLIHRLELDEARHLAQRSMLEADAQRERAAELDRLANTDVLTGLPNRRHADAFLASLLQQAVTSGQPMAAALLDIDRFKRINDRFGHPVGDRVLAEVGGLLHGAVRSGDFAARFGGEEFLIVLVGPPEQRAVEVCERIRETIRSHDWPAIQAELCCTVSIGLAPYRGELSAAEWLALADQALYAAKRDGRDRVVRAGCV
ncbi:MAG TPA: diguanylate cyclase [Burkholderiaceae bacterium]